MKHDCTLWGIANRAARYHGDHNWRGHTCIRWKSVMSKKSVKQTISAQYFRWVLYERKGTFYADGRSGNSVDVGRHSLDTKIQAEAISSLKELDVKKAVEFGLAQPSVLIAAAGGDDHLAVSLEDGRKSYVKYVGRPPNLGGASAATLKRYRPVFDKFISFAREAGVKSWNRVTKALLIAYGTWLHDEGRAARTQYLECTTILQTMKWLVEEKLIPASCTFTLICEGKVARRPTATPPMR